MTLQSGPLFYMPAATALDAVGVTIPGAQLFFYLTDSDTAAPVYSDGPLTVPITQPVVALDDGIFPKIYCDPDITYRVVWTGPDDGINPPEEFYTWDPVKFPWPANELVYVDIPFEFLTGAPPVASQVMGLYFANRAQRFPGNFDGTADPNGAVAHGGCLTNPTAEFIVRAYLNGVTSVGYMRIATDGTTDFFTASGTSFDLDVGEFLEWRAPADVDATVANIAWTIPGWNL